LSVRNLEIVGSLNVNDFKRLRTINGELLKLNLDCVGVIDMFQLLYRIGQQVKTLTIGEFYKYDRSVKYVRGGILLEFILELCPNLEHFVFKTSRMVFEDDDTDLPPSAFQSYKE
jgi:hypothetical protein